MQRLPLPRQGRWLLAVLCPVLLWAGAGCSGSHGKVTGKVTMSNGQPLPGGTITFAPVSGKGNVATAWIQPDGTYELDAPTGECKISIDNRNVGKKPAAPIGGGGTADAPPPGASGPGGKGGPPMGPPGKGGPPGGVITGPPGGGKGGPPADKGEIKDRMKESGHAPEAGSGDVQPGTLKPINPKYYNTESSGLTYTVKGGTQTFDIKLDP